MTESDFRRLEVALSSLGIYYYEVVSPGSRRAGVGRLTESDLNVVKASWSCIELPLGCYYEVVPAAS